MSKTTIEWTDETDNPIVVVDEEGKQAGWYCQKVSPGCQNCYAERLNGSSFYGGNKLPYKVLPSGQLPKLGLKQSVLDGWQRKTPNGRLVKHFVGSMTDLFADFVPAEWVFQILDAMLTARRRIFQLLTKRPRRMRELVTLWLERHALNEVPHHIWLGVSIEDQKRCDERMPEVALFPEATIFLSCEPLLAPLDLSKWLNYVSETDYLGLSCDGFSPDFDWVIVGGESGRNARPMHPSWATALRQQCKNAGVPFFFKQWGEWAPIFTLEDSEKYSRTTGVRGYPKWVQKTVYTVPVGFLHGNDGQFVRNGVEADFTAERDCMMMYKVGKKTAGRLLDGRTHDAFPLLEGLNA